MTGRVRTGVLISGRGSNMSALIEAARNKDFPAEIALVLSDKPQAAGIRAAQLAGVAALGLDAKRFAGKPEFEAAMTVALAAAEAELICLAGFMRILSPAFVERWRGRILNIHPSLLPDLRGLQTHERALAEGRAEHGCTVHFVTADLDAGPIVAQARVPVLPGDDADRLAARVLVEEHRLYPEALATVARAIRAGRGAE
ncbi:phosphoribosylglycinamide formyltransferase [Roseiarcus sp.]|uniref:phosphoribosylglycinamide formyltransferase n=1 Tax=Roseiarcus sp. TaxID=1969460 RepID=UPI003F9942F1